ncbi:MAG TPA: ATP-binding cassette domain-containing protein [Treponemataceae bacterium]|nr:ATP-binding cassette domain-containing protein [Treponemataceae bacterium]
MHIILEHCDICKDGETILRDVTWDSGEQEHWLVTGSNGAGKSVFAAALAGEFDILPRDAGEGSLLDPASVSLVSFETAAELIEEEKRRDDSDFVDGGVDPGRTPRKLIMETISRSDSATSPDGFDLESHPAVTLFAIEPILDRGLKYLSTGEIRRTLLASALAARPTLLILDEPYEGLDTASRARLLAFLSDNLAETRLILVMDKIEGVPDSVTRVIELENRTVSYAGPITEYLARRQTNTSSVRKAVSQEASLDDLFHETSKLADAIVPAETRRLSDVLVEMRDVTIEWSGRKVLDRLSWTLRRGEHWLIRGPNGSGKTTFLELITGDNPQVYRNDVRLFGIRRGSGETIWEIKEKLGIVSYRLHTEYRALGEYSLETVLLSGLHDSIGLYQQCGEEERLLAVQWLALAGFSGKERLPFRELSYGEQRAILIARAAIKCPPILILDEPCHGLDAEHRTRVLTLLSAIADGGTTTLLHVTHDPTEALPCERHILELRPGECPMYRILER